MSKKLPPGSKEGTLVARDHLKRLTLTTKEKKALLEAVVYFHLSRLAVADGSGARPAGTFIMKITDSPTPDGIIQATMGVYEENIERYQNLASFVAQLGKETEQTIEADEVAKQMTSLRDIFEAEVKPDARTRNAIFHTQRVVIKEANEKIADARKAYDEAVRVPKERLDAGVVQTARDALSPTVKALLKE